MPKELKTLLAGDFNKRFAEQGVPDLLDRIADETIATEAAAVRDYMEKVSHPALTMPDMAGYSQSPESEVATADLGESLAGEVSRTDGSPSNGEGICVGSGPSNSQARRLSTVAGSNGDSEMTPQQLDELKKQITTEILADLKTTLSQQIVREIISTPEREVPGYTNGRLMPVWPTRSRTVQAPPIARPNPPAAYRQRNRPPDHP